ncbi:MAG: glycosyltransferase [Deltaproteobacteria bacterium]|nr:glycosyltransferase [Candidatus Anaeroferrophillacea bacterium]
MNTHLGHAGHWAGHPVAKSRNLLALKLVVSLAVLSAVAAGVVFGEQANAVVDQLCRTQAGRTGVVLSEVFSVAAVMMFAWRFCLFCRYRPLPCCAGDELPTCAVIVPAFNEGKQVLLTLRSVAASNYPSRKLQIFAVDDGSVDDTWFWISSASVELGRRLTAVG